MKRATAGSLHGQDRALEEAENTRPGVCGKADPRRVAADGDLAGLCPERVQELQGGDSRKQVTGSDGPGERECCRNGEQRIQIE